MIMKIVMPSGRISPLKPPANTSSAAGAVPMRRNTASETAMNTTVARLRARSEMSLLKAERKDIDV